MTNENKLYERYINKLGKKESENSYNTFHKIYLKTTPSPTYKELAKITGFAESTCRNWINFNEYQKRKEQIIAHQEEEKNNAIKNTNDIIIQSLAKLQEMHVTSHNNTVQDTINRQNILPKLETTDKTRIQLHKEDTENNKSWILLLEGLEKTNNFDDYMKEAAQDTTVLNELLEKIEDTRIGRSIDLTNKLKEEYKDEEY